MGHTCVCLVRRVEPSKLVKRVPQCVHWKEECQHCIARKDIDNKKHENRTTGHCRAYQGDNRACLSSHVSANPRTVKLGVCYLQISCSDLTYRMGTRLVVPVMATRAICPIREKMATILHAKFSNAFSWMKSFVFWFEFHWSLFQRAQMTNDNTSALVQVLAWCQTGDRLLSGPMLTQFTDAYWRQ